MEIKISKPAKPITIGSVVYVAILESYCIVTYVDKDVLVIKIPYKNEFVYDEIPIVECEHVEISIFDGDNLIATSNSSLTNDSVVRISESYTKMLVLLDFKVESFEIEHIMDDNMVEYSTHKAINLINIK